MVFQRRLPPHWREEFKASHLSYTSRFPTQYQVAVKLHGVFLSCRGSPASSRAPQFHRALRRDNGQVVTPFMQVGIYPTRDFATLGILLLLRVREGERPFLPPSACRHTDRTISSRFQRVRRMVSEDSEEATVKVTPSAFPADCPHRTHCYPLGAGSAGYCRTFQHIAGFCNGLDS